jgi:hypothetical protein
MKRVLGGILGGVIIAAGILWILLIGLGPGMFESLGEKASIGHFLIGAAYVLIGIAFVAASSKGGKKPSKKVEEPAASPAEEIPVVLPEIAEQHEEMPAEEKEAEVEYGPQEGARMENKVEFGINRQYKCADGHKKYCLSTLVSNCHQNDEWLGLKHDESDVCDVEVFYTLDTEKGLHIMFAPAGEDWKNRYDREQKTPWRIVAKCGAQRWSAGVVPISGQDYHAALDVIDPRFIATVTASLIAGKDVDFLIRSGAGGFSITGTISAIERFRFTTMFCGLLTSQWNEYLEIGQLDRIHVAVARIQMDAADRHFEATKEFYDRIYDLLLILCKRDPREHVVAYDDWNNPEVQEKNRKPEIRTYAERDVDQGASYKDIGLPIDDYDEAPCYEEDPEFAEDEEYEEPEAEEPAGEEEKAEEAEEAAEADKAEEPEKEEGAVTYF